METNKNYLDLMCLGPIDIGPEVLVKCGFDKAGESYRLHLNSTIELAWYTDDNILRLQTISTGFTMQLRHIKSAYQLQKLYYSLTDKNLITIINLQFLSEDK